MNKTSVRVLFFCVLVAFAVSPLSAFDGVIHNRHIQRLLFGNNALTRVVERKIERLNEALYVSTDSTSNDPKMRNALAMLKGFGVPGVPRPETITVPHGPHHERYTHLGWNFLYRSTDTTEKWNLRKKLLLDTIGRVFNLDGIFDFSGKNKGKKDSLGALLYYTHILGDHWGNTLDTHFDRMPLSPRPDNRNDPTVLSELEKHITILFADQPQESRRVLDYLRRNKGRIFNPNNPEEFEAMKKLAEDTLNVLWDEIPRLLQKEAFFTKAFS